MTPSRHHQMERRKLSQDNPLATASLDQFEFISLLATGTFGSVKLCQYKPTGKYYAVKILQKVKLLAMNQVQHIKDERQILMECLFHPRIVCLYKTLQDDEFLYMFMEYVPGGEIFSHLRKCRRFDVRTAKYYAAQILLVLEDLHSKGIVYRDLKPENLLLDENGQLKITDFGFAKKVEDVTFTLCGTPEYLAPEILLSQGHSKAVDWWALGILLYEMLAGNPPFFDETNPFKTYEKIVNGELLFPQSFDVHAKDIIQKLLRKEKSMRYGNLRGGASDVKNHSFFRGVDWDALLWGTMPAPIKPELHGEADTRHFPGEEEEEDEPFELPTDNLQVDNDLFAEF